MVALYDVSDLSMLCLTCTLQTTESGSDTLGVISAGAIDPQSHSMKTSSAMLL